MNVIYNTDGVNGISANVVEQNIANWAPPFPTPGFLIQNNTPPPDSEIHRPNALQSSVPDHRGA